MWWGGGGGLKKMSVFKGKKGWGGAEEFNSLFIVHFMSHLSLVLCLKDRTVMSEL